MSNGEVADKLFERIERLERHIEEMSEAGQKPSAIMFYGKVVGIVETMEVMGLINSNSTKTIRDRAWKKYTGKDAPS